MGKMKAEESVEWPRFPGRIGKRTAALCSLRKQLNLSPPQVNAASGTCIVKQVLWSQEKNKPLICSGWQQNSPFFSGEMTWMEGSKHLHGIFLAHSPMRCEQVFGGSEYAPKLLLAFVLESRFPVSSRFFFFGFDPCFSACQDEF